MNDLNPYKTPSNVEHLNKKVSERGLIDPQRCDAAAGWGWINSAFSMFMVDAFKWIGLCFIWLVILLSVNLVPLGSFISSMVGPLFSGGFAFAARRADVDHEFDVSDLFEGFRAQIGNLLIIGTLYAVASFVVLFIGILILLPFVDFDTLFSLVMTDAELTKSMAIDLVTKLKLPILLASLVVTTLMLPLIMAIWFAPVLAMLHDVPAFSALKMSFKGCIRNLAAFTVYALVIIPIGILATIPLGIGWFVLGPVMALTTYTGYKAIFLQDQA